MRTLQATKADVFDFGDAAHQRMMADIDSFTSTSQQTLNPDTIEFLVKRAAYHYGTLQVYRAVFADSISQIASNLSLLSTKVGSKGVHDCDHPTCWTTNPYAMCELIKSEFVDERYAVAVMAFIDRRCVLLDMTELSPNDLEQIYLLDPNEVIVSEGKYTIEVLKVIDRDFRYAGV